ncbi:cell wall protein DAN4-like [Ostrinia furnacalis]|uniref:cell wall protein DAN4-like n=1 Tax=Ostrinia furnacalis TaxID=93504 RepID=UPI0010389D7A|nr:cell wall protein DAN4-like [Ostrinia furnacalis]
MACKSIILLFLIFSKSLCDDCFRYDFEDNFEKKFSPNTGICFGMSPWALNNYTSLGIDSPHPSSSSFISPTNSLSCVSSVSFSMGFGVLELNVYVVEVLPSNSMQIYVMAEPSHLVAFLGYESHHYKPGWNTLRIRIQRWAFQGYVVFMGEAASPQSVVLIDSFRYIPSTIDDENCIIYPENNPTSASTNDVDITTTSTESDLWTTPKDLTSTITNQWTTEYPATVDNELIHTTDNFTPGLTDSDDNQITVSTLDDEWIHTSTINEEEIISTTNNDNNTPTPTTGSDLWTTKYPATVDNEQFVSTTTEHFTGSVTDSTVDEEWIHATTKNEEEIISTTSNSNDTPITSTGSDVWTTKYPATIDNEQFISTTTDHFTGGVTDSTVDEEWIHATTKNEEEIISTTSNSNDTPITSTGSDLWVTDPTDVIVTDMPTTNISFSTDDDSNEEEYTSTTDKTTGPINDITTESEQWVTKTTVVDNGIEEETVTEMTSVTESSTSIYHDGCITYNFEAGFDSIFSSGSGLCYGANPWILYNYTSSEIQSWHPDSTKFISPYFLSCITSTDLRLGSGVVEINVYMADHQYSNFTAFWMIHIIVQMKSDDGFGRTVAVLSYNSHTNNFLPGWNSIRINIRNQQEFDGHIILMGMAENHEALLVDSFLFIPATMSEDLCFVYSTTAIPPSITTINTPIIDISTDGSDKEYTTKGWITKTTDVDELTTMTSISDQNMSTYQPIDDNGCITYNFEENLDSKIANDHFLCPKSRGNHWTLQNYSSLGLESPHPLSTSFISPLTLPSCIATTKFFVKTGTLEIIVFFESAEESGDHITIMVSGGIGVIIAYVSYTPRSANFVSGWNTLSININLPDEVAVDILLTGSAAESSIVLVDSFRYIPSTMDEKICVIYDTEITTPTDAVATEKYTDDSNSSWPTGTYDWTIGTTNLGNQEISSNPTESGPTVTYDWGTGTTNLDSQEISTVPTESGSTGTYEWTIGTTNVDNQEISSNPTESGPTVTYDWGTGTTNLDSQEISTVPTESGSTGTYEWTIGTTNVDNPEISSIPTESGPTVTYDWGTGSTNLDNQEISSIPTESGSTGTYDWTTGTTNVDNQEISSISTESGSTGTYEWTIGTTNVDNQEISSIPTEPGPTGTYDWGTGTTNLDSQEISSIPTESTVLDGQETVSETGTTTNPWITTSIHDEGTDTPATETTANDSCTKYNFEKDFDVLFTSESSNCRGMHPWTLNNYTSIDIENLQQSSNLFISPITALSCVESFKFVMGHGTLEFRAYIGDALFANIISVLVRDTAGGGVVTSNMYSPLSQSFAPGWNVLRVKIERPQEFEGYFILQGSLASVDSVVLIDSFRYIPATMNEELCTV